MNRRPLIPQNAPLSLLVSVVLVLTFATTPSFAAVTRLLPLDPNELHGDSTEPHRGLKVCLVVRDARRESVVKTQMCGVMRNAFGKAIYITLLKNPESLDTILAYSIADSLKFAGYEVVKVYPNIPDRLSSEPRDKPKGMKADIKIARKSQSKSERGYVRTLRDLETFGEGISFSQTSGSISAKGDKGWTNGADAVLEVSIDKFSSDNITHFATIEVLAWSSVTLVVAPGESSQQGNLATTTAHGWGELTGGGASKRTWKRALDMSYRMLVNKTETVFLSDEFYSVMKAASGSAGQTD